MEDRSRYMMMQWDGLGTDEEFYESMDRMSSAISVNLVSDKSDEEDDEYNDSRMSFASAISSASSHEEFRSFAALAVATSESMSEDYRMWMTEPGSIKERRKRLLQGMGLSSNKELLRLASKELRRVTSKKIGQKHGLPSVVVISAASKSAAENLNRNSSSRQTRFVRSRSCGWMDSNSHDLKQRKERFFDGGSSHRLLRSSSLGDRKGGIGSISGFGNRISSLPKHKKGSSLFMIKNLDTGKEFVVNEFNEDGMWNRLRDLQTGKQLTLEEFEKCVGHSPIVSELMRREKVAEISDDQNLGNERKVNPAMSFSQSIRLSKRRGVSLLKNIKGVAHSINGFIADKDRELAEQKSTGKGSSVGWTKVRHHGKSCKELTALYRCQEIQAHEGSIWAIKFTLDARYMASAGQDRVIHVWEVVDCDPMTLRPIDEANFTPLHPMMYGSPDRPPLAEAQLMPSDRKRRGVLSSISRKSSSISDYVVMPETVFSLSEKPVCSFLGHLDEVLDLSWSKSQLLLSSSMDKTVRLWDMDSKSCLKLFAHNDYVTCIQFNPHDDRYFISGSLDSKVRIWSIPDRKVVDWTDLPEMVTAACYTPDGQGALVGTHLGSCRMYNTSGCKLQLKAQIEIRNKKKSNGKKITGFQFSPGNPSEVLITSADSRIRIFDGSDIIHKFRGFKNTTSQISASFTPDGKHVLCASEDSQVYIWKRDEIRNAGSGRTKGLTTRSHEHFQCRNVSVAVAWPGSIKYEPPLMVQSKRHSKRSDIQPSADLGTLDDAFINNSRNNSKSNFPPLPRRTGLSDRAMTCPEEELARASSRTESGSGRRSISSAPDSTSSRYGDSPYISRSHNSSTSSLSSRWFDIIHGSSRNSVDATAWGMGVVTAGHGGEIRTYQNLGLPVRQTNIFREHI